MLKTAIIVALAAVSAVIAQTTTGEILGTVSDASGAVVSGAKVTVRNLDTNGRQEAASSENGTFRIPLLPSGSYEVIVEKTGFANFRQGPITLRLNQQADLKVTLQVSGTSETVAVNEEAPLLNTTNAEISTHFDTRRIADLPLSTNRNVLNLAASVPGVAQISAGNSNFGSNGNQGTESGSLNYSANGMRLRSNAFIIDGQDSYYPSTGGLLQPLNNPDIIQEVRLITNQFLPEYGRAAGSVMNIVTRSGTNQIHGSAFWFHNSNHLNALSNTDKLLTPRPREALFRIENQFGGTIGGPVIKDKLFVFGSALRWTDRRLGSGSTINGALTEQGRQQLAALAGNVAPVRAFLDNLPAGNPNGQSRVVTFNGQTATIPLGSLTGSGATRFDDWQYSYKGDWRISPKHGLSARYMDDDSVISGTGQLTPAGLSTISPIKVRSASVGLVSTVNPTTFNELRLSFSRYQSSTNATNPEIAERIPSIEIPDLGLRGFNNATTRTGIGLAANLPQYATLNNYQVQETFAYLRGNHSYKLGIDFRRQEQFQFFLPQTRGRLEYATLQRLIDDQATTAQINTPLRGGELITYMRYYDYFFFLQDEWRVKPNFTVSYGVRYESPGNSIQSLANLSDRIAGLYNNNPDFKLNPRPNRDTNNWAPRLGFNYRFGKAAGILGWLTGDQKLVVRGGYSRTYDVAFNNIALNIASSFPLVLAYTVPTPAGTSTVPQAYTTLASIRGGNVPPITSTRNFVRTIVSGDFRSPYADQYSLQFQRELRNGWVHSLGYVGTKGTALYQTIDGNPNRPNAGAVWGPRVDPTRDVVRERCNCASSTYHSLQTSLEKRLSKGLSMAAHYTWSSFIDSTSEIFNPSVSGEIAFPQNPYDRRSERARATYDRPHRFTTNGVFELPWMREQRGIIGRVIGGWQLNGFLTLQSGAPYGVLNGADPALVVQGNVVGTSIRPFLNTTLDLSRMTVREIQAAGGRSLFTPASVQNPIGNVGRNVLRSDGINRVDLGVIKNVRVREGHRFQIHANLFNAFNTRDWGIPDAAITSPNFLNEGINEVAPRRIQLGLRYSF